MAIADKATQKEVSDLVRKIFALKQRNRDADVSALECEIDRLVYALYGLTPEEIQIVERSVK
jgi:adenine-specific DNA-methyltransferase